MDPRASDDIQAVSTRVRAEVLEPFIEALALTLREMAGAEVVVQSIYDKIEHRTLGDVSAVLGLAFPAPGSLVLSFPEATAATLARRVLAEVTNSEPDQTMIHDCLGEAANVIAGQAKALLLGTAYHFNLSTPTVIDGAGHEIRHPAGAHCLVVTFASDLGDLALELSVNLSEPNPRRESQ